MAIIQACFLLVACLSTSPSSALADISWQSLKLDGQSWAFDAQDIQTLSSEGIVLRKKAAQQPNMQHVDAFVLVQAPMHHIFSLITDFQQLPAYAPHVEHIEILNQNDNAALVGYTLALPLGIKKRYRLNLSYIFHETSKRMAWQSATWQPANTDERIAATSGYWFLQQTASSNVTFLAYQTITDPGDVPFGLGWVVEYLSHSSILELLSKTKLRAEAQWAEKRP